MKLATVAVNQVSKMVILHCQLEQPANILASYLNKITGGEFKVCTVNSNTPCIALRLKNHGNDGFCYYIEEGNINLEATSEQAMVYCVYDFLEQVIGCRYYTSKYEYIPFDANLTVSFEEYSYHPVLQFRELLYKDYLDSTFANKHKLVSPDRKEELWGFWCHSFQELCPAEEYFEIHPEYFSLREGQRLKNHTQLCLSNPEVLELVVTNLRKEMEKKPEAIYWSVSQNDNAAFCQCEKCKAVDDADESQMGSILTFVNQVAERFPDKTISTLAYWYSRKPPKITRPAQNVHILLCNIEANRGAPIETDDHSRDSREELLAWKEICNNVFLWDYCIQFRNLVSPFPNLQVLAPNIRFFVENNVTSLFSQCNREVGGEFCELRGYLLAKLMWNPYLEEEKILEEFLEGYYHQSAPYIHEYIKKLQAANKEGLLNIFGGPQDGKTSYLSLENYRQYQALFAKALKATEYDKEARAHVETAELPLLYAGIVLKYGTREEQMTAIGRFAKHGRKIGLEKVEEWIITTDRFVTDAIAEF